MRPVDAFRHYGKQYTAHAYKRIILYAPVSHNLTPKFAATEKTVLTVNII